MSNMKILTIGGGAREHAAVCALARGGAEIYAVMKNANPGIEELAKKVLLADESDIELGICGEHGGDPSSIAFCHKVGLDYVSCSPFRVPIARLAAAQAAIKDDRN